LIRVNLSKLKFSWIIIFSSMKINQSLSLYGLAILCILNLLIPVGVTGQTKIIPKKIAMLDLVELSQNKTLPTLSEKFIANFSSLETMDFVARNETIKRLEKYNRYLFTPCNDPQCAFDLGSLIESEYILYGTATRYEDLGILSLKLLSISEARIVWSHSILSNSNLQAMEQTISQFKQVLNKVKFDKQKFFQDALLAVISHGDSSVASRIVAENVFTLAYNNQYYEIMSPNETDELLNVLEIDKKNFKNSLYSIKDLGKKLGVKAILYSEYSKVGLNHKNSITLFDIKTKSVLLSMPGLPQNSISGVLDMEKKFFAGMNGLLDMKFKKSKKSKK